MRIDFFYTNAKNGGFGVLGNGIKRNLELRHELVDNNPDVVLCYGVPQTVIDAKKKYGDKVFCIYYTVWESTKYQKSWAEFIKNNKIDLVLTATEHTKWVLSRDGIDAKVWHHGIDKRWEYKKRKDDGIYTFIHYNAYEWRKGWDLVFKAFIDEFTGLDDVQLIFKARNRDGADWIIPHGQKNFGISNITEILGHISNKEMVELMETVDCGVFPVHGEGWFLPSMECAAQGIPVILPKQMGMAEQWIDGGYIDIAIDGWFNCEPRYGGAMIQPSLNDLKKKMRWCYKHQEEANKMGKIASEGVHKKFNWDKVMNELDQYLNLIIK